MKRGDYLLCALLAAAAIACFFLLNSGGGKAVRVTAGGKTVLSVPLERFPARYEVPSAHGTVVIVREGGRIRVLSSPCPDKICVQQGAIDSGAIICAPEETVVEVSGGGKEAGHDAIIR